MRLILHAGLHRAGSSSIQMVLQREAEALKRRRVLVMTQQLATDPAHQVFKLLRGHKIAEHGLAAVRGKFEAYLGRIAPDYDTIIFSDENMPGLMPGKRQAAFANARDLAGLIESLKPRHEIHGLLVLREHIGYLRSVHNFRLARAECGDFSEFFAGLDLDTLAMAPLTDTLAGALGQGRLHVFGLDGLKGGQGGAPVMATLASLSGAEELNGALASSANKSRNAEQLAFFRALNAAGVFVPLRAPRQKLVDLITTMPAFPECSAEDRSKLLDHLRTVARRLPFAVNSEQRLRLAGRLHGHAAARLMPGVTAARLDRLLQQTAEFLARAWQEDSTASELDARLWQHFAADRRAVAERWLPQWRDLAAPA